MSLISGTRTQSPGARPARVAIMQPYFLPYIGYFQLIAAVDQFILYDNIKYTKKGWINRNRMLRNGEAAVFTLPLKGDSDALDVRDREIAPEFRGETLLAQVRGAYMRAPHYGPTIAVLEAIALNGERNLYRFIEASIVRMCEHLGITTELQRSSGVAIDHGLRGQDKVLALCEAAGATVYVNPIGGVDLYSREAFAASGIDLRFLRPDPVVYPQFDRAFVPQLSIVDVLMFNPLPRVRDLVRTGYALI